MGHRGVAAISERELDGLTAKMVSGRVRVTATCVLCGKDQHWDTATVFDHSAMVAKVRRTGWKTGRGKVACLPCQNKKKEKNVSKPVAAAPAVVAVSNEAADAAMPKVVASEAAKRAKRMAYMALIDYYDDAAKRYKPGHSDASIAAEVGCAEVVVAKIREDDFGPLGTPTEITQLIAELGQARAQVARLREEGAGLIAKIEVICKSVTALEQRFSAACVKNGWKQ